MFIIIIWQIALFELQKGKFKQSEEKCMNHYGIVIFLIVIWFFNNKLGNNIHLKTASHNFKNWNRVAKHEADLNIWDKVLNKFILSKTVYTSKVQITIKIELQCHKIHIKREYHK